MNNGFTSQRFHIGLLLVALSNILLPISVFSRAAANLTSSLLNYTLFPLVVSSFTLLLVLAVRSFLEQPILSEITVSPPGAKTSHVSYDICTEFLQSVHWCSDSTRNCYLCPSFLRLGSQAR